MAIETLDATLTFKNEDERDHPQVTFADGRVEDVEHLVSVDWRAGADDVMDQVNDVLAAAGVAFHFELLDDASDQFVFVSRPTVIDLAD